MPLSKVPPGARGLLSGSTFNTIARAVDIAERSQGAGGNPLGVLVYTPTVVMVQNSSGADITNESGVLGINGPIITPAVNLNEALKGPTIDGVAPVAGTHEGNFVVVRGPLKSGSIGRGVISGATWARVDIVSADDLYADIADGDTAKLVSGATGFRILWQPGTTGEQWALVNMGQSSGGAAVAFGKVTSVNLSGNTAAITPSDADGTIADPAPDSVTIYLTSKRSGASNVTVAVDDVIEYLPYNLGDGTPAGVMLSPRELPAGSGEGKHLQLDASNQPFWDYPRFLP